MQSTKIVLLLCAILMMTVSCFPSGSLKRQGKQAKEKEAPIPLLVSRVSIKEVPLKLRAQAQLQAYDQLEVRNTFGAKVEAVYVEEGQTVNSGDNVLKFIQGENVLKLELARAELKEAETGIDATNGAIDDQNRDDDEEKKGLSVETLEKQISYYEAKADRARAEITLLEALDRRDTITSPLNGIVRRKRVTVGSLFGPEDILLEIMQINPIKLRIQMPQEMLSILNVGSEVLVDIPSVKVLKLPARIANISPDVNPQTGLVEAVCILNNDDGLFRDGLKGQISIPTTEKTRILMADEQAVFYENEKPFVYRIINEIAKKTAVTTGQRNKGLVQVQSGLNEGDLVAIQLPTELKDGHQVELLTTAE